jgi:membrane protease YdiL (CAAX protease family)
MTSHAPATVCSTSQTTPRSRDAWLCVVAILVGELVAWAPFWAGAQASPTFSRWLTGPVGSAFMDSLQGCVWLLSALWFSRIRSIGGFLSSVGLRRPLTLFGCCAAWVALGLAFLDRYGASRGWTGGGGHWYPLGRPPLAASWWLATKAVLLVPFYEEVVIRGFLYQAFRRSHGVLLSTTIILCFSAFVHGSSVSRSLFTFGVLTCLCALVCLVREWTGSLWGCLLCHAAYNAILFHLWLPALIILALLLPFLASGRASERPSRAFAVLSGSAEPSASPNGGPAVRPDGSGVGGGPPSVS